MKTLSLCFLLSLAAGTAFGQGAVPVPAGDGDPFPVACSDFSGEWRSDQNHVYRVGQQGCARLQIEKTGGGQDFSVTIVPDGVSRSAFGTEWKGTELHRWNSLNFGAIVETHRTMVFTEKTVTEFTTLEEVNNNLILENTYRVIQGPGDETPRYEYDQQVFRRVRK